jgi:hypothetical protein
MCFPIRHFFENSPPKDRGPAFEHVSLSDGRESYPNRLYSRRNFLLSVGYRPLFGFWSEIIQDQTAFCPPWLRRSAEECSGNWETPRQVVRTTAKYVRTQRSSAGPCSESD